MSIRSTLAAFYTLALAFAYIIAFPYIVTTGNAHYEVETCIATGSRSRTGRDATGYRYGKGAAVS